VQRTNTRLSDRLFAAAGPQVWNSLPTHLELDIILGQFRRSLKTLKLTAASPSDCFSCAVYRLDAFLSLLPVFHTLCFLTPLPLWCRPLWDFLCSIRHFLCFYWQSGVTVFIRFTCYNHCSLHLFIFCTGASIWLNSGVICSFSFLHIPAIFSSQSAR